MIREIIGTIWIAALLILSLIVAIFAAIWAIVYIIKQIQFIWYYDK